EGFDAGDLRGQRVTLGFPLGTVVPPPVLDVGEPPVLGDEAEDHGGRLGLGARPPGDVHPVRVTRRQRLPTSDCPGSRLGAGSGGVGVRCRVVPVVVAVVAVLAVLPAGAVPLGPRFGECLLGGPWVVRRAVAVRAYAPLTDDLGRDTVAAARTPCQRLFIVGVVDVSHSLPPSSWPRSRRRTCHPRRLPRGRPCGRTRRCPGRWQSPRLPHRPRTGGAASSQAGPPGPPRCRPRR